MSKQFQVKYTHTHNKTRKQAFGIAGGRHKTNK